MEIIVSSQKNKCFRINARHFENTKLYRLINKEESLFCYFVFLCNRIISYCKIKIRCLR